VARQIDPRADEPHTLPAQARAVPRERGLAARAHYTVTWDRLIAAGSHDVP